MQRFIAIDFETANKFPLSACALGVVVFENGNEIMRKSWLIKPPSPYDVFDPIHIRIHGITQVSVKHASDFTVVFHHIKPYLQGSVIIAHNASFDIGILRELMRYYHLEVHKMVYGCTVQLARKAFEGLPNHKLDTIAKALGFPLQHHDALSDAVACANILLTIMIAINQNNVVKSFNEFDVRLNQIF